MMREISLVEVDQVSGGFSYLDAAAHGSLAGGVGYGGYILFTGGSVTAVSTAFGAGAAVGAVAGVWGYGFYSLATYAGADKLGGNIGSWVAGHS